MASKLTLRTALMALSATALSPVAASAQTVQVGIASAVVGDARISTTAAPKEHQIVRKERVSWGDTVRTRKKSELHILLLDRSNFTIGSNTRMVIDRFVYDPNEGRSLFARVLEGAFRFMSGAKNDKSTANIDSPVGTIGIRGTALDGVVGGDAVKIAEKEPFIGKGVRSDKHNATLIVLRGPGQATEGGLTVGLANVTAADKTVTLDQPEFAAYIPRPGAAPIGPFRLSASGLSDVQDLLSPTVVRANKSNPLGKILAGAAAIGVAAVILTDHDKDPEVTRQQAPNVGSPNASGP